MLVIFKWEKRLYKIGILAHDEISDWQFFENFPLYDFVL